MENLQEVAEYINSLQEENKAMKAEREQILAAVGKASAAYKNLVREYADILARLKELSNFLSEAAKQ